MAHNPSATHNATRTVADGGRPGRFRLWIDEHDERWLFILLYVGLAIVLSLFFSLFWLVYLIAIHAWLELIKLTRLGRGFGWTSLRLLWEIKIDFALLVFAFALSVYLHTVFGLLGLGPIVRAGTTLARTGARATAWQGAIRGTLLSTDDLAQVGRAVAGRRGSTADRELAQRLPNGWRGGWGGLDWFGVVLGVVCLALIFVAPLLTGESYADVGKTMLEELDPIR